MQETAHLNRQVDQCRILNIAVKGCSSFQGGVYEILLTHIPLVRVNRTYHTLRMDVSKYMFRPLVAEEV